ncbi:MAG: carboxypeptidase regulatory-like domain-containing protein [Candidatus Competibacteraceae bacterium]|nr:carboxypeptidase regulatory-like domain-containing protein [Candidatus Competibacteraceae bacterium]MCP5124645.1 carboxypeptidase regulatory-like domain-containing protein [Gammaproteobacteria bacterium]HRX71930.1 carboxypeptidase-like regulatory domain-containing protein [Candidatus Competibacteraceae bacterium]
MAMIRLINLTIVALALSTGLNLLASAQQTDSVPPAYSPPPSQQPLSPSEGIQFYTRPGYGEPAPVAPARTPSYPGWDRGYAGMDSGEDSGPDWLPPGGLVHIQESQGVRYVSGGIGEGERDELNALSSQFNLRLLFAMQGSGDYLADVRVSIMDESGKTVLNAESQGPWFFAQLPPGAYRVEANVLNQTQQQAVRVSSTRQSHLNFYWR